MASFVLTLGLCATWLALAACFCSVGVACLHRLTGLKPNWGNAYLAIWTGFALVISSLLVWNFFLPVNERTLGLCLLASVVSLRLERRWFSGLLSKPLNLWFALVIGVFAVWVANHALFHGGMDDYNYEFQAIRWFRDYRVVPGLGNLSGRIGFNDSHHLLAAMLSFGPWSGAVNHVFNGFFAVLALVFMFAAVRSIGRNLNGPASSLLAALLLCPCVGLVLFGIYGPMISTLKADVFECSAAAVLAVLFLQFAMTPVGHEQYLPLGVTIVLLGAVMFSVKISAVVFCSVVALTVVIRLAATVGWRNAATRFSILIAALIFGSVPIRGILLTGYPFYPSTALGLNVDWRVPVAQAAAERAFITSVAQLRFTYDPAAVQGWTWIPDWARTTVLTDKFNIVLPLVLASLCAFQLLARHNTARKHVIPVWAWTTLAAASLLSLVLWFVMAPTGRFGLIYFWIIFALLFVVGMYRFGQVSGFALAVGCGVTVSVAAYVLFFALGIPRQYRFDMILMLAFALLWFSAAHIAIAKRHARAVVVLCLVLGFFEIGDRVLAHVVHRQFTEIRSMLWLPVTALSERFQESPYFARRTLQGELIYVVQNPTYETPLPNTRYFNPWLELRVPGDLGAGFRNRHGESVGNVGYSLRFVFGPDGKPQELISSE